MEIPLVRGGAENPFMGMNLFDYFDIWPILIERLNFVFEFRFGTAQIQDVHSCHY